MKYYVLDKEEQQIEEAYEKGKLLPVKDKKKKMEQYRSYAQATLQKVKNINIRLAEKTLIRLKAHAARTGIPYQTLASSIIHQFVIRDTEEKYS